MNTGRGIRDYGGVQDPRYASAVHTRRMENFLRIGTVMDVNYKAGKARVRIGDPKNEDRIETDWVPWALNRASNNLQWDAPELGEQVMLMCPSGDLGNGVIFRGITSDKFINEASSADVIKETFREKPHDTAIDARFEFNRKTGEYVRRIKKNGAIHLQVGPDAVISITDEEILIRNGTTRLSVGKQSIKGFVTNRSSSFAMTPASITHQVGVKQVGGVGETSPVPSGVAEAAAAGNWTPQQQGVVDRILSGQQDRTFGPGSPNPTDEDLNTYVGGRYSPAGGFAVTGGVALAPNEYYLFSAEERRSLGIMDIGPAANEGLIERYYGADTGEGVDEHGGTTTLTKEFYSAAIGKKTSVFMLADKVISLGMKDIGVGLEMAQGKFKAIVGTSTMLLRDAMAFMSAGPSGILADAAGVALKAATFLGNIGAAIDANFADHMPFSQPKIHPAPKNHPEPRTAIGYNPTRPVTNVTLPSLAKKVVKKIKEGVT